MSDIEDGTSLDENAQESEETVQENNTTGYG